MSSTESEQITSLRAVLDQALADGPSGNSAEQPRVYHEGEELPPAAQEALDRRDPAEMDRRWREATGQA